MTTRFLTGAALLSIAAVFPTAAQAQAMEAEPDATSDSVGIDDIIVTATRRDTTVQSTPIAITALGGDELARAGVTDVSALARTVPTVQFVYNSGVPSLYIRGIGLQNTTVNAEAGVALHLNGIYLTRPVSVSAAFFDLERVEVLRGPQGTLYGRNATGGAINFLSTKPTDETEALATVEIGNYDRIRGEAVVSGPLGGGLKARVAGFFERRDGYTVNLANGERLSHPRSGGIRGTLDYSPADSDFSSTLVVDFLSTTGMALEQQIKARYPEIPGIYVPVPPGREGTKPFRVYSDMTDLPGTQRLWGGSLTNALVLDGVTLKTVTGYRYSLRRQAGDFDGTDAPNLNGTLFYQRSRSFSQEFQIASNTSSPFQFLVGAYYFHDVSNEINTFDIRINLGTLASPFLLPFDLLVGNDQRTNSYAAFGEASYEFTPELKATVGIRYSKDRKTNDGVLASSLAPTDNPFLKDSWGAVTPKFVLEYNRDRLLLYASATRGFKAGGFNNVQRESYDPEYVWTYEVGAKQDWLGDRLRTNLSAFYSDYSNLQVTQYINNTQVLRNAASARIAGVEFETLLRPTRGLEFSATATYLDAKYTKSSPPFILRDSVTAEDVDMTGKRLPFAPKFAYSISGKYSIPVEPLAGDLSFEAAFTHRSKSFLESSDRETEAQGGYGLLDLRAGWESSDGKLDVALFARNVTNKVYFVQALRGSSSVGGAIGYLGDPRTYGIQLRGRF